jgi:hypothetical protein
MRQITIYSGTEEIISAGVEADSEQVLLGAPMFAFTEDVEAKPGPADWHTGVWASDVKSVENINGAWKEAYVADILASDESGGGTLKLPTGESVIWLQLSMPDGQRPLKLIGKVKVL